MSVLCIFWNVIYLGVICQDNNVFELISHHLYLMMPSASVHLQDWYPLLFAAFDTIDHEILLQRLRVSGGECGTALTWFRSYPDWQDTVCEDSQHHLESEISQLRCVPATILFTLYSAPIASIVRGMDWSLTTSTRTTLSCTSCLTRMMQ